MSDVLSDLTCPGCGQRLTEVHYPSDSMLNEDQWWTTVAGSHYCDNPSCTAGRQAARTGYRYFWPRELPLAAPPSAEPDVLGPMSEVFQWSLSVQSLEALHNDAVRRYNALAALLVEMHTLYGDACVVKLTDLMAEARRRLAEVRNANTA